MVAETDSQVEIPAIPQNTEDMSVGQAWNALLGLDDFDPFASHGSVNGVPFAGSSMADEFHLADMNFSMPTEPPTPHQALHPATDVFTDPTLTGSKQRIPPTSTTELRGSIPQPWPPPLPSVGPEVSTVQISDAVLSSLRDSLEEDERQRPTTRALGRFLGAYFDVFNVHLPLFHVPAFDFDQQPQGLLLAMAAIGALYCLEHRSATLLYWAADTAAPVGARELQMESSHQSTRSTSLEPSFAGKWQCLAHCQTRLLLQYFGIFGGGPELTERSLGMIAELSLTVRQFASSDVAETIWQGGLTSRQVYRTLTRQLKVSNTVREEDVTWTSWLERECTKRYPSTNQAHQIGKM